MVSPVPEEGDVLSITKGCNLISILKYHEIILQPPIDMGYHLICLPSWFLLLLLLLTE